MYSVWLRLLSGHSTVECRHPPHSDDAAASDIEQTILNPIQVCMLVHSLGRCTAAAAATAAVADDVMVFIRKNKFKKMKEKKTCSDPISWFSHLSLVYMR